MKAHDLRAKPDKDVQAAMVEAKKSSKASGSMYQQDFPQEDGSTLTVASFRGGDAELIVTEDGSPAIEVPRLDDSPDPTEVPTEIPYQTNNEEQT